MRRYTKHPPAGSPRRTLKRSPNRSFTPKLGVPIVRAVTLSLLSLEVFYKYSLE